MALSANSDWRINSRKGTPLEVTPVRWRPFPIPPPWRADKIPGGDFELPAAFDQPPALEDVQLFVVRRAEIVDGGPVVQSDRIDHERITLIVADGLLIPGGLGAPPSDPVARGTSTRAG
jgi:hypothetical protein